MNLMVQRSGFATPVTKKGAKSLKGRGKYQKKKNRLKILIATQEKVMEI